MPWQNRMVAKSGLRFSKSKSIVGSLHICWLGCSLRVSNCRVVICTFAPGGQLACDFVAFVTWEGSSFDNECFISCGLPVRESVSMLEQTLVNMDWGSGVGHGVGCLRRRAGCSQDTTSSGVSDQGRECQFFKANIKQIMNCSTGALARHCG